MKSDQNQPALNFLFRRGAIISGTRAYVNYRARSSYLKVNDLVLYNFRLFVLIDIIVFFT